MSKFNRIVFIIVSIALAFPAGFAVGYIARGPGEHVKVLRKTAKTLRDKLNKKPRDPDLHAAMARVCSTLGKPDEALEHAKKSINFAPDDPDTWERLGWAFSRVYMGRCRRGSSERCEEIRSNIAAVARKLMQIVREKKEQNQLSFSAVSYCMSAKGFFRKAGEEQRAQDAHNLAVTIAEKWAESGEPALRTKGERLLEILKIQEGAGETKDFNGRL